MAVSRDSIRIVVDQRIYTVDLLTLSDEQIHHFASQLNSLQAGADDGLGVLIFLLVVAIVVVLVLQATGHRVIIR